MNKTTLAAALTALVVAGGGLAAWLLYPAAATAADGSRKVLYWYDPMNPAKHYDHEGVSPDMGMKLVPKYDGATAMPAKGQRRIAYWTDPMQPGSRYDKPGKSPLMDMDLVPVYAQDNTQPGAIAVAPDTLQHTAVRYATVQRGALDDALTVVGTVKADDRRVATAISKVGGWVTAMPAHAAFDAVAAGSLLATIASPEGRQMAAEYAIAQGDPALRNAARQRLATWGVSPGGAVAVTAPQGGFITEVLVHPGAKVDPGQPIMTITNLDRVWVVGELLENDANRVKPGDAVTITLPAAPGEALHGKVESVLPQLAGDSRTLPLRVSMANPGHRLRPGMLASLTLSAGVRPHLLVPSEAVIRTGRRNLVVLAQGDGQFVPVAVVTGREAGGRTEILSGLTAGQRIVASSQFLLDSESNLQHGLDTLNPPNQSGDRS
ncbi:efflux RND transporter periplasmic adaptor subunit [Paludibacterium sp.]|uniref:efflux RND transporter periplasmic adaptor subunit n=1 Tax=Paludibacterium sp. TaxID=1917523 RepID=UPI0025D42878|nr:efflux RND transporter periplasmic adaptor subunit [Paludibacterium sp.]MBV8649428.1 efflux RND transporter periplasmic adaptor subunit [Paludibacterium sp.]